MKDHEKSEDHLLKRAKIIFASGDPEKSIAFFTRAELQGRKLLDIWLSRGAAFMAIGRYHEASDDFTRILERDSRNERASYFRGIARVATGKYEEGIKDLTISLGNNNSRGIAHLLRGLAYAELGNKADALLDINSAKVFSDAELASFRKLFGDAGNPFQNTKALLAEENAPWNNLLSRESASKLLNLLQ